MSLMATSYRFEVESGKAKALQKALGRQDVRVKNDEEYAERAKEERSNIMTSEIARWSESLEEGIEERRIRREGKEIGKELKTAGKALINVRRAQLTNMLEEERIKHEKELASLGKAFYFERL